VFAVRPVLRRLIDWHGRVGRLTPPMLAVVLVGLMLSAAATQLIGVHFVFGAFLFGAALPRAHSAALVRDLLDRLEQVAVLVLLPVFFVVTGLAVNIRALTTSQLGVLGIVLAVACVGKFVGAAAAARLMKVPPRQAVAVGILMNTRGLTELVVVNVGYAAGILSRDLLTILVVMAVVTTIITKPLLQLVYSDKVIARDVADAERQALEVPDAFRCLVVLDDISRADDTVTVARDLAVPGRQTELVISCLVPLPVGRFELASGFSSELEDVTTRLEAANALAARMTSGLVTCSVVTRFSSDVMGDILAQTDALQPDCVVEGRCGDDAEALSNRLPGSARVVLLGTAADPWRDADLTDRPLAVSLRGGPDAAMALVTALQLAEARSVPLGLVEGVSRQRWSRPSTLLQRLRRLGHDVTLWTPDQTADALVITERDGPPAPLPGTVARVWAVRDGEGDDLDRLLDELLTGAKPAHDVSSEAPWPPSPLAPSTASTSSASRSTTTHHQPSSVLRSEE
jgi:hypothetical protein